MISSSSHSAAGGSLMSVSQVDRVRSRAELVRQVVPFLVIGVASTAANLLLYVLFRTWTGAQVANLVAVVVTTVGNIAANRRFTFGIRGRRHAVRHQYEGFVVLGISLALTSGALAALQGLTDPAPMLEIAVLVLANLAATVVRFVLYRGWVFHPRRHRAHG
jgi:putative flippase GtrA